MHEIAEHLHPYRLIDTAKTEPNSFIDGDWIESEWISEKGIRLVQTGNIGIGEFLDKADRSRFIDPSSFSKLGCKWVRAGDILICRLADPIGRACRIPTWVGDCITAVDCTIFRPNPRVLDAAFAIHLLNYSETLKRVADVAGGSTRQRISRSALGNLVFHLPSVDQQRAIAAILDAMDEAIGRTEALIGKLQKVKAGLLHDLLTRGLDEHGQLRDPLRHPEKFKDSQLGRIPKEWEVKRIDDLAAHVGSGITPTGGSEVYTSSGVLFIRSQNVTFEGLKLADVAFVPETIHRQMSRSEIFPDDVLLNITGASIGRCCVMPPSLGPANVNQHVCAIRLGNPSHGASVFLAAFLASPQGQNQIDRFNAGSNRQGLNYKQVRSMALPFPSEPEECTRIAALAAAPERRIQEEERHLAKLRLQKQGLMQDLLTGRVRVPGGVVERFRGAPAPEGTRP